MSSVFVPSIIASACPTEVTGTPSEIATVKGLPSVCSIATLQETADEPVMTSSDSLHPRGTAKGGTEYAQPEGEPTQESGAMRTAASLALAAGGLVAVHLAHTAVWKQWWREKRDNEEEQWTPKEMEEGDQAERKALKLPPTSQTDEEEEEASSRQQLD